MRDGLATIFDDGPNIDDPGSEAKMIPVGEAIAAFVAHFL